MESATETSDDLSKFYQIDQFSGKTRVRLPGGKRIAFKLDISHVIETIEMFAPDGHPTISTSSQISLRDETTGKSIQFNANELTEIVRVIESFAVADEPAVGQPKEAPFVDSAFDNPVQKTQGVPSWITDNLDFKPRIVGDDGSILLDFTPLKMKSKYIVSGKAKLEDANAWGYAVNLGDLATGWIVLVDPQTVLVTGIEDKKHSKHRTMLSALFRLSSHLKDLMESD